MAFGFGSKKRRIEETKRARREEKRRKRLTKPLYPTVLEGPSQALIENALPEEAPPLSEAQETQGASS